MSKEMSKERFILTKRVIIREKNLRITFLEGTEVVLDKAYNSAYFVHIPNFIYKDEPYNLLVFNWEVSPSREA